MESPLRYEMLTGLTVMLKLRFPNLLFSLFSSFVLSKYRPTRWVSMMIDWAGSDTLLVLCSARSGKNTTLYDALNSLIIIHRSRAATAWLHSTCMFTGEKRGLQLQLRLRTFYAFDVTSRPVISHARGSVCRALNWGL